MKILTPAKINIVLRVLGRRQNGYHDLLMLNEKLRISDEITIDVNSPEHQNTKTLEHRITITCDDPSVPCDETNLCYKAAKLLLCHPRESGDLKCANGISASPPNYRRASAGMTGLSIHIKKRIPVAAGLGGGSSDAAAVLKGMNELLHLNLSVEKLAELGVKLGADVPFFLHDGPAICEGIGDKITTLGGMPNMWILLINPNFPVSTKWVYAEFDRLYELQLTEQNQGVSSSRLPDRTVLSGRDFKGLSEVVDVVRNDLEPVTANKYPEIRHIEKLLMDNGALVSWMSGSGPTVVGMFDSEKARNSAFEKLNRPGWKVIRTSNKL